MRYLLDTHMLLFMLSAPCELSAEAKRIACRAPGLFASIASLGEIGIKQGLGKLRLQLTVPEIERS